MNSAEKRCFKLLQEIVCKRDRVCRRCGATPISAHHVFGRKNHGSAFDPNSCLALCQDCHDRWARRDPQDCHGLLRERIGEERFAHLEYLSRQVVRLRDTNYKSIAAELGKRLENMKGERP